MNHFDFPLLFFFLYTVVVLYSSRNFKTITFSAILINLRIMFRNIAFFQQIWLGHKNIENEI